MKEYVLIFIDTKAFQIHQQNKRMNALLVNIVDLVGWSERRQFLEQDDLCL